MWPRRHFGLESGPVSCSGRRTQGRPGLQLEKRISTIVGELVVSDDNFLRPFQFGTDFG